MHSRHHVHALQARPRQEVEVEDGKDGDEVEERHGPRCRGEAGDVGDVGDEVMGAMGDKESSHNSVSSKGKTQGNKHHVRIACELAIAKLICANPMKSFNL